MTLAVGWRNLHRGFVDVSPPVIALCGAQVETHVINDPWEPCSNTTADDALDGDLTAAMSATVHEPDGTFSSFEEARHTMYTTAGTYVIRS